MKPRLTVRLFSAIRSYWKRDKSGARRGMAVVLVLGMLAMTLALSYASLRGQATVAQLAENAGRGETARLAAESGAYAALRKISQSDWAGVGTTISGQVADNSWYEVNIQTGDAALTPADPKYGEYAYRLTITSTGYASDPANADVRAIHKIDVIVQLARRALYAEPANWASLESPAVYQWAFKSNVVQFPSRIEGPATILGKLNLASEYPATASTRQRYLKDLNGMRQAGLGDYRPLNGPVTIAYTRQDAGTVTQLQSDLGLATSDTTATTAAPQAHPNIVLSYKLYPGGKSYACTTFQTKYGSTLQNLTLAPDPLNNPLGIYRSNGPLTIGNNVNITGTIISSGTAPAIQISGKNVSIQPADLALLEQSTQVWQMPSLLVKDDLKVLPGANVTIKGQAWVYDEFDLQQGSLGTNFLLDGQLFASSMALHGHESLLLSTPIWDLQHALFLLQYKNPPDANTVSYFPQLMKAYAGLPIQPTLTVRRNSSGVKYHWQTWTQPIYQKDPTDSGLRWNLIRWEESL
jgi:hypothetical protein